MSKISYRNYIGIPFKDGGRDFSGVDCYGILVLIYKMEKGINLWDTSDYTMDNYSEQNYMLTNYHKNWIPVDKDELQELDALLFTLDEDLPNIPTHVAVYIGNNRMLHCVQGVNTYTCKFAGSMYERFFHSAYRHKGMAD